MKISVKNTEYQSALTRFDYTKSTVNHLNLIEVKRNCQRSEAKPKRQYLQNWQDTFLIISIKIIQEFYKNFRKRKPTHTSTELDLFRKHFENLSTVPTNTDNNPPVDTGTTLIEELHIEI